LTDCVSPLELSGTKALNRSPYIANIVTGDRGGEPVTLIMAKQELILSASIADHQNQMARVRLHIENFGHQPVLTANIEEFAIAVPANIDSDLFLLPRARSSDQ
jgi:hypothetical protein